MRWKLEGTSMETCHCATACPCLFSSDPTEGAFGGFAKARCPSSEEAVTALAEACAAA